MVTGIILTAVTAYLLGSLNCAIITVRLMFKEDIRTKGSNNAGLTNTLRCYGKIPAVLTLIGDLAKGIIAVLIGKMIFLILGFGWPVTQELSFIGYLAGLFAVVGHVFPVFHKFKGGKGVLVCASVLIVIDPMLFFIMILSFVLVAFFTRYVSVGSIAAALIYPFAVFFTQYTVQKMELQFAVINCAIVAVTAAVLIVMHRGNIKRLIAHTENRIDLTKYF
ncbi:MAG: glycerol-3-phosphate 1-O-acyltransferase PlsY [Oscillospiraceae bacterium]|jgi:glycerol-3-phosphate acyltransferase PlsY|nr:glycerol-3-phosphate 1-O-acyltransferase PlsY [Oscillospiraceae bacterium]